MDEVRLSASHQKYTQNCEVKKIKHGGLKQFYYLSLGLVKYVSLQIPRQDLYILPLRWMFVHYWRSSQHFGAFTGKCYNYKGQVASFL